ncbi:hypothetical protein [Dictyobacter kobayashii]|uniref:Uncharacterized protein n=1 Tax=Dictyobacter kobayashii TaxID=2014872 RepID=A0A402AXA6_9CHLR|nr:hypothetical protein [Dictyobacter kobayashii]GCE23761.1 hypothetical protein KDK_75610 [Dictyobacter kobayashii]
MNLFGIWKRQPFGAPVEVIQAACDFYGISPERVPAAKAEKLTALSNNVWVVKLNDNASAVVAYTPKEKEHTITAPWYGE